VGHVHFPQGVERRHCLTHGIPPHEAWGIVSPVGCAQPHDLDTQRAAGIDCAREVKALRDDHCLGHSKYRACTKAAIVGSEPGRVEHDICRRHTLLDRVTLHRRDLVVIGTAAIAGHKQLPYTAILVERHGGLDAVADLMAGSPAAMTQEAVAGAAESWATRPVMTRPPVGASVAIYEPREVGGTGAAGGMSRPSHGRRVLVHPSGFRQSPYADIKPPGEDGGDARGAAARQEAARQEAARHEAARQEAARQRSSTPPRKLWHSSPGSSGA